MNQYEVRKLFIYVDGSLHWRENRNSKTRAGDKAGTINNRGYRLIYVDGKLYSEHRLIYLYHRGIMPKIVDHIDRDRLNNRIGNLRPVNSSLSNHNRNAYGTSGFRGVSKRGCVFQSSIVKNGKRYYLGSFPTAEDAYNAYKKKSAELYGQVYF